MRVFKHFNVAAKKPCIICGTSEDKEAVLVAIDGTEEGNIAEAIQIHLECIDLRVGRWFNGKGNSTVIYQVVEE